MTSTWMLEVHLNLWTSLNTLDTICSADALSVDCNGSCCESEPSVVATRADFELLRCSCSPKRMVATTIQRPQQSACAEAERREWGLSDSGHLKNFNPAPSRPLSYSIASSCARGASSIGRGHFVFHCRSVGSWEEGHHVTM